MFLIILFMSYSDVNTLQDATVTPRFRYSCILQVMRDRIPMSLDDSGVDSFYCSVELTLFVGVDYHW